ncbi:Isochorismate synthase DhbC [Andreprevotia sp. IGB-42]|uniref:isochorismate synthase n=1 Tax=Andreprevotia sp. IGB-42 TaxID=2497473 RepID=UPI00135AF35E|nr:isochorismate synthase [Andreprevotia sp. IGB-42]KAF0812695.1 Isochorismate synthase DhbC [Andreprevotia sp. IGB-42]
MNDILHDSPAALPATANALPAETGLKALPSATELLARYHTGASLFSSPRQTVLGEGIAAVLPPCPASELAANATMLLNAQRQPGQPAPVLLGAIPFQLDAPARLFIPAHCELGSGVSAAAVARTVAYAVPAEQPSNLRKPGRVQMQPCPQGYQDNVSSALLRMRDTALDKVVLSRSLTVEAGIDVPALLQRLASRNPRGYTFAISLGEEQPRTLVGASPELLLTRQGTRVVSNPLAGSIPRSADPAEDRRRAEGLLQSAKDKYEHALVVDAVGAALRPFCSTLHVPAQPVLLATPTMWHLSTEVYGELADPATTALELALALHPTPAVCGHPTADAREFIQQVEGFDRRFFTGLTGWCNADGDGEWAVTIRCAEVGEQSATLYAGAGIVAGSEPVLELRETSAKLRTMLGAMQLEAQLEAILEGQS